jgi:hypothetical protein
MFVSHRCFLATLWALIEFTLILKKKKGVAESTNYKNSSDEDSTTSAFSRKYGLDERE